MRLPWSRGSKLGRAREPSTLGRVEGWDSPSRICDLISRHISTIMRSANVFLSTNMRTRRLPGSHGARAESLFMVPFLIKRVAWPILPRLRGRCRWVRATEGCWPWVSRASSSCQLSGPRVLWSPVSLIDFSTGFKTRFMYPFVTKFHVGAQPKAPTAFPEFFVSLRQ